MHRLGYTRYVGQAAAVGASVTELVTTLGGAPGDPAPPVSTRNRPHSKSGRLLRSRLDDRRPL